MLEVNHVSKSYGDKKALQGFDCALEPGEVYGLLGANDSGKTTLMKLIADLILPDSGKILLNGTPVSAVNRAHTTYMSAKLYFYPYMKIKDVSEYYRDFFVGFSQETHHETLDVFRLNPGLRIKSLSSGMMAKVKVTVTISRKTGVILLDESLNGIGLIARDRVMDLIISRAGHESTLLFSSRFIEEMERPISKTIFAKDGDMIADLDVEELRVKEGLSLTEKYRQLLA